MTTYRSLQSFLDKTSEKLQTLQLQAATGSRITRASDDPTAISPVLSARTQIQTSDRYIETIQTGLDRIDNMDGYFDSIENTMVRLKEISIATVNSAMSQEDLATYADEVRQLQESLLDDANAQVDGRYLFAGFDEKTQPFTRNPDYPNLTPDPVPVSVLGAGAALTDSVTLLDAAGNPIASADLPLVVAGEGSWTIASDAAGYDILEFTPEAGFDGTATPVGYTITDGTGTSAPMSATAYYHDSPVLYNGDYGDLEYEIAPNELISVNLPGNQLMLGDLDNDGITDADKVDIFALAASLEEALRAGDITAIEDLIDPLEQGANQLRAQRSLKGNVGSRLETALSHMEQVKIDMEEFRSRYEDADILETITSLQQQQESFQAALSVTGKVSELSILDYI